MPALVLIIDNQSGWSMRTGPAMTLFPAKQSQKGVEQMPDLHY
jgi:hypothetical protein